MEKCGGTYLTMVPSPTILVQKSWLPVALAGCKVIS